MELRSVFAQLIFFKNEGIHTERFPGFCQARLFAVSAMRDAAAIRNALPTLCSIGKDGAFCFLILNGCQLD